LEGDQRRRRRGGRSSAEETTTNKEGSVMKISMTSNPDRAEGRLYIPNGTSWREALRMVREYQSRQDTAATPR
jgi:hypothetical protein